MLVKWFLGGCVAGLIIHFAAGTDSLVVTIIGCGVVAVVLRKWLFRFFWR